MRSKSWKCRFCDATWQWSLRTKLYFVGTWLKWEIIIILARRWKEVGLGPFLVLTIGGRVGILNLVMLNLWNPASRPAFQTGYDKLSIVYIILSRPERYCNRTCLSLLSEFAKLSLNSTLNMLRVCSKSVYNPRPFITVPYGFFWNMGRENWKVLLNPSHLFQNSQEPILFAISARENIAFGVEELKKTPKIQQITSVESWASTPCCFVFHVLKPKCRVSGGQSNKAGRSCKTRKLWWPQGLTTGSLNFSRMDSV